MSTRCRACQYSSTPFCAKHQAELNASVDASSASTIEMMVKEDYDLLTEIDDDKRGVTTWEGEELASCMERLDKGHPLTINQRLKAREIMEGLER